MQVWNPHLCQWKIWARTLATADSDSSIGQDQCREYTQSDQTGICSCPFPTVGLQVCLTELVVTDEHPSNAAAERICHVDLSREGKAHDYVQTFCLIHKVSASGKRLYDMDPQFWLGIVLTSKLLQSMLNSYSLLAPKRARGHVQECE